MIHNIIKACTLLIVVLCDEGRDSNTICHITANSDFINIFFTQKITIYHNLIKILQKKNKNKICYGLCAQTHKIANFGTLQHLK